MPAITTGFQVASVSVMASILLAALYAARRWRAMRPVVAIPSLWAGYGVVYYSLLLAGYLTPEAVLLWGALHRLLAGVIFLAGLLILIVIMASPGPLSEDHDLE